MTDAIQKIDRLFALIGMQNNGSESVVVVQSEPGRSQLAIVSGTDKIWVLQETQKNLAARGVRSEVRAFDFSAETTRMLDDLPRAETIIAG